jgi:hypothetical protein
MAWIETATMLLRNFINDVGPIVTYSDDRLEELLVSSAFLVNVDVGRGAYTINMETLTITPDPLSVVDYAFVYLCVLRARLILCGVEYKLASQKAFSFRDGPSSIDGRASSESAKELMNIAQSDYNRGRLAYFSNDASLLRAIIGPHNISSTYNNSPNDRFF